MYLKYFFLMTVSGLSLLPVSAKADYAPAPVQEKHELTMAERLGLARQFVEKISRSLEQSAKELGQDDESTTQLADGEELLFRLRLKGNIAMASPVLAVIDKRKVLVSFRDFVGALELPIKFDETTGKAEGWYIREKKTFQMDSGLRQAITDNGTFHFSDNVKVKDGDVFVPVKELAQWFNFKIKTTVSALDFQLETPLPLPVLEAMERRKRLKLDQRIGPPVLPTLEAKDKPVDYPFVDISTRSSYNRPGSGVASTTASATVRTAGDLAGGTLITQSQLDKEEKFETFRANYKRESLKPELLGPLGARRFEIGDVNAVMSPLQQNASQGLGVRVTNADPLKSYLKPSTEITGTYFPDWDVELYRGNQLLDFQTIGDDGQYRFENVDLYNSGNNFRLVFYGPQGEVKEELFDIPVDTNRLADTDSAYDIAIASQAVHSYDKQKSDAVDKGSPLLTASYEKPLGDHTMMNLGLEAGQLNAKEQGTLHTGLATTMGGTLLNFDTAIDQDSEIAGQIVARRDVGKSQIRNELMLSSDHYKKVIGEKEDSAQEVLKNEFDLSGPLPFDIGKAIRYNLGLAYSEASDHENQIDTSLGLNTTWNRVSIGQDFTHSMSSDSDEDTLNGQTTFSGFVNKNRLRFTSDYEIKPENKLTAVKANLHRKIAKDVGVDFTLEHALDPKITTGTSQVNWNSAYADISPSISYNSENDVVATLNTRFGLVRNPQSGSYESFGRNTTGSGAVAAFVYLDKDGNRKFDGEDEPIPNAMILAPQNGGNKKTDEKGYAVLSNMSRFKLTDVYVAPDTLPDPFWIPAFEGASVLPREGHVDALEFPVHMSGEMDGTIYARDPGGSSHPLRSTRVSLYERSGKKVMSVSSESDGFFLLSKIPPGTYYLMVDDDDVIRDYARPLPQKVTIGYEGTTIYGNNIYFEGNSADVPMSVFSLTDIDEKSRQKLEGKSYVLNLGSYKSQLMMSLIWFKVRNLYADLIDNDTELLDIPSESYPDEKTGKYQLRVAIKNTDLETAYKKCQRIAEKGQSCSLEILSDALFAGEEQPAPVRQASAKN